MTTLADPVPGARPGAAQRAGALAGGLAGRGVHGVVPARVDTAGITRVKAVHGARPPDAAAWGVGMPPVSGTFLSGGSVVTTDVLGCPDGGLRLHPGLGRLVAPAARPGRAWVPVDPVTQDGERHPGCGRRTVLRRIAAHARRRRGITFEAALEIERVLGRGTAPRGAFEPAVSGPAYGAVRQVEVSDYGAAPPGALAARGVEAEQFHPEYAAGQFEASTPHRSRADRCRPGRGAGDHPVPRTAAQRRRPRSGRVPPPRRGRPPAGPGRAAAGTGVSRRAEPRRRAADRPPDGAGQRPAGLRARRNSPSGTTESMIKQCLT